MIKLAIDGYSAISRYVVIDDTMHIESNERKQPSIIPLQKHRIGICNPAGLPPVPSHEVADEILSGSALEHATLVK